MRFSVACICGYETPLVDDEQDIDYDLLHAHQEFCEVCIAILEKNPELREQEEE